MDATECEKKSFPVGVCQRGRGGELLYVERGCVGGTRKGHLSKMGKKRSATVAKEASRDVMVCGGERGVGVGVARRDVDVSRRTNFSQPALAMSPLMT